MTQPSERIVITLDDQRAISAPLAAECRGVSIDTMRRTIARLVAAGDIQPLDKGLDERTPLYSYDALIAALDGRPGKGSNFRNRGNPIPVADLVDGQQEFAYNAAIEAMANYQATEDSKDRAAREIVTELWDRADIASIAERADYRAMHVSAIAVSVRQQGANVGLFAIDRAAEAVAKVIVALRGPDWALPHDR